MSSHTPFRLPPLIAGAQEEGPLGLGAGGGGGRRGVRGRGGRGGVRTPILPGTLGDLEYSLRGGRTGGGLDGVR